LRRGLFPACWQTTPRQQTPFLLLSLKILMQQDTMVARAKIGPKST
jgi:hypothetical protein